VAAFGGAVQAFRDALHAVDVGALTGAQCASLLTDLAQVRKACEAVEASLAARAASTGAHRRAGFAAPHDWLAALSGTTAHAARTALETVAEVEECPATRDALFDGRVSVQQAREIVSAEQVAPGSEGRLVKVAEGAGLRRVREAARHLRVSAIPPEALREHQHAARSFTWWTDELGMVAGRFRLMPEEGAALVKRLEAEASRLRRETKSVEPAEALLADAFTATVRRTGPERGPRADIVLVCDLTAWLRGHGHAGEITKIVGGSPLPVSTIQALSENAFFKVVLHDGQHVQVVQHYGRKIPTRVLTALELGFPPEFDGTICSEEGCDRRFNLERDHVDPHANGGVTNLSNLEWECGLDHRAKTERDRAMGLLRGRSP
jgi:hypothetical protein